MTHRVTGIYIYPVKSLAGISLPETSLCATGLKYDRRWMLVDENNIFITQRDYKELCLFKVEMLPSHFRVHFSDQSVNIPHALENGTGKTVKVWESEVQALVAEQEINDWFSTQLRKNVSLVYMPDTSHRTINPDHIVANELVSFADGYPLLLIGEASLNLLQSKIAETIPMDRFRPNIVFSGTEAHEEDSWHHFTINNRTYRGIKPCRRCTVTTINQQTGVSNAEPLKTLATYRRYDNHILFGQNVAAPVEGSLSVGDMIEVLDYLPQ